MLSCAAANTTAAGASLASCGTHCGHIHFHCDRLGGTVAIAVADGGAVGLDLGHCRTIVAGSAQERQVQLQGDNCCTGKGPGISRLARMHCNAAGNGVGNDDIYRRYSPAPARMTRGARLMLLRRVLCRLGAQRTLVAFRTLVCMIVDFVRCKDAAEQKSFLQTTPDPTGGCLLGMMARPNSRALQAAARSPQTH
jgi:hypothetical protein